ncbi:conserved protein of unknown function (plasmid) [Rhodovastum atsumiense]|uniref:Uncharacterized protein n=1 Tax=Rhodovastum atsumiense TaxID=504468 RepID=A0A5M6ITG9_9PROT|nr:hypothetical protein [Rhodovastum atsumiense]KAA5611613.1 hypothetical protein F1189_13710 [Rhodovastum atsumiense]CAH2606300.1 conserved protein of unknown function [Rhodovastum atsumiense]
MSDTPGQIDVPTALRNIIGVLQENPANYRLFGVWWWPVKLALHVTGHGQEVPGLSNLPSGKKPYMDEEQAALVPKGGVQEILAAAFEEYGHNARFGRPNGQVETPDGEVVTIYDPDIGF